MTIVIQLARYCFLLQLIDMLWVGHSKFRVIPKMEKGRAAQCT